MFPPFKPEENVRTPYLFFTGKGGVGKTSTASALSISLANLGKKVLIVSTDPASNLQDVFETELTNEINAVPGIKGLYACNLDPEEAARTYKEKVVGPFRGKLPESVLVSMEEQLSGACSVEIAAFDEFTNLLVNPEVQAQFDHIIFDTAPTGHTLRLLQLPTAWSDFLNESTHGASCLGPLSGLGEKQEQYAKSVQALADSNQTTLVLVSRPERSSLLEAERASKELGGIGICNQTLLINGILQQVKEGDPVSVAFYRKQQKAMNEIPNGLRNFSTYAIPLVSFSLMGIPALSQLFSDHLEIQITSMENNCIVELPSLQPLIDDLDRKGSRVIFTMGKGGVGKTTVASAIAIGLLEKGHKVHLTTTDPAAHLFNVFDADLNLKNLSISRIDPKTEVENYRKEVLSMISTELDEDAIAYIQEDLESPCTEEIAIFRAFAEVVSKSKEEIVVIDTAPTGHTLLLLDATQSYHKELERSTGEVPISVKELLPRLRNSKETEVVIVTLPEATPVFEAGRLQKDLQRADIHPKWWVINQSLQATNTKNPILSGRAQQERKWIEIVQTELAEHIAIIPWLEHDKVDYAKLRLLLKYERNEK